MADVKVRRAETNDMPVVAELINALNEEDTEVKHRFRADQLIRDGFGENPAFECLVAETAGAICGYLLFFRCYDTVNGGVGLFMMDLYVRPEARSRRVGRRLMAELAEEALQRRSTAVYWGVYGENRRAIDFYERIGAEDTGARVYELGRAALSRLTENE